MSNVTLMDDAAISKKANELWEKVMEEVNRLIFQAKTYGFSGIGVIPDPNVHQMLLTLRGVEGFLDVIIDADFFGCDSHDDIRCILNTRECIRKMEYVARALKDNDQEVFNKAVADLESQAPF